MIRKARFESRIHYTEACPHPGEKQRKEKQNLDSSAKKSFTPYRGEKKETEQGCQPSCQAGTNEDSEKYADR
jgi:hypothetical protein